MASVQESQIARGEQGELKNPKIKLAVELTDPYDLAKRTGGKVILRRTIPWSIEYDKGGTVHWRGYPDNPSPRHAVPYLRIPSLKVDVVSLAACATIVDEESVTIIEPNIGKDVISGFYIAGGIIYGFQIPSDRASETWLSAQEMARQASRKLLNGVNPQLVRNGSS